MSNYREPLSRDLFFTKNDPDDPRLGEISKEISNLTEIEKNDFVVWGYPDDEGITLNGGRKGAAQGPSIIRRILYKMTPTMGSTARPSVKDFGNLKIQNTDLDQRHKQAAEVVGEILSKGGKAICLGGGHDYGYPDFSAFCTATLKEGKRPFIVNFDAHLDVRPDQKGSHSGTPFYKLLNEYADKIDFFEVGLQDWCNSTHHLNWALSKKAHIHSLTDIDNSRLSLDEYISRHVFSKWKRGHRLALSVDMDGFPAHVAPGASQVFPVGLDPKDFLSMWSQVLKQYQADLVGFYETSPPLDLDDRTSRMAALLIHRYIYSL